MSKPGPKPREDRQYDGYGWYITRKGYARFNRHTKMRHAYVHRYVAAKMLGRPLRKDEEIHHRNFNKLDFSESNLKVVGTEEHGWITAKQNFWMNLLDIKEQKHFFETIEQLEREGLKTGLIVE